MNEPKLKDDMIGEGKTIYAHQVGRDVTVIDTSGNRYHAWMSETEGRRFMDFVRRLGDAWKEYDKAQG